MPNFRDTVHILEDSLTITIDAVLNRTNPRLSSEQQMNAAKQLLQRNGIRRRLAERQVADGAIPLLHIDLRGSDEMLATNIAQLLGGGVPAFRLIAERNGAIIFDAADRAYFDRTTAILGLPGETVKVLAKRLIQVATAPLNSEPMVSSFTVLFASNGAEIARLPVDLVVTSERAKPKPRLATYASRFDWLRGTGAVPSDRDPVSLTLPLPIGTFSSFTTKRRGRRSAVQWIVTPNAEWSDRLLRHLRELRSLGFPVSCTLANPNRRSQIKFPVERIELLHDGVRHGLYLPLGKKLKYDRLVSPARRGSATLRKRRVNAELFWGNRTTHVVAPTGDPAIKREAFALTPRDETDLFRELASGGGAAKLPVIETKTPVYRFYLDVDLDHGLYERSVGFKRLKAVQRAFFGADSLLNYGPLRQLVGHLFPEAGRNPEMARAMRKPGGSKEGHHIVFAKVLVPNDDLTGRLVAAHLEAVAARAISREEFQTVTRFLARMLEIDARNLDKHKTPLTIHIRPWAIAASTAVEEVTQLTSLLRDAVLFGLRNTDDMLVKQDSAELIDFAMTSMGQLSLDRHMSRLKSAVGPRGRAYALYRIARRCRWEILRRARYFDHSVYGPTMGLRMLGTVKPGDDNSRYMPVASRGRLTLTALRAHSIRRRRAKPSMPSAGFAAVLRQAGAIPGGRRHQPRSLDGLFMGARLKDEIHVENLTATFEIGQRSSNRNNSLLELRFSGDDGKQQTLNLPLRLARQASVVDRQSDSKKAILPKLQILQPARDLVLIARPPRRERRSVMYQNAQTATDWSNAVNVRVRVFIPSPAIAGPFGPDFGGDGRGPSYAAGDSRLDVDIDIDLQTGAIRHQEHWGPTTSYDSDDTIEVPGKPSWWRDKAPGASPTETSTLPVTPENVSVAKSTNPDGSTSVTATYSGSNPLVPFAPPIDGRITITFNPDGSYDVDAAHDGFPSHTAYVNGQLSYEYDPVAAGKGPFSLAGDDDTTGTNHFPAVPPRPGTGGVGGQPDDGSDGGSLPPDDGPDGGSPGSGDGIGTPGSGDGGTPDSGAGPVSNAPEGDNDMAGGYSIPVDVTQNSDGSVTATAGNGTPETFTYDPGRGAWIGDGGSYIDGDASMFGADIHIEVSVDENGELHFYFCSGGSCVEAKHYESYGP